ncbi:MAG: hypothetical protein M3O46_18440 [Myxococcota bacterium]|nr:hypothetical protein [Myxococcota bacterium]
MFWPPLIAVLAILAVLGTDRLGRPLTDDEKKRFGALLREHDCPGARLVALRFAYNLTRSRTRAQDLMGRVDLRLVRLGWDPKEVALVRRLCRLVWSEWSHAVDETDAARRAADGFLVEMKATGEIAVPPIEQQITDEETRRETLAKGLAHLEKLRASFEKEGDEVNLLWLEHARDGEMTPQTLAQRSGRDVTEFYAAAKRRKRAVQRLLAEERGVPYEEDV